MDKKWIMIFAIIIFIVLPTYNIFASWDINYAKGLSNELSSLCKGIENSEKCAAKIEAYQLKKGMDGN